VVPAAVTLRPEPASVREARRFVARRLADGGFDAAVFTAELLVSELVTNAILHARTDITLSVDLHGDVARVSVADASPRSVLRRQHSVESGTGRGLVLVDRMATRWGIDKTVGGKCVWFELPAAPPADAWDALEA
jgi:anti-sigma regulatory factor (Ser/Thr protein kinase)